jgi:putative membrane-bound dehydrogenase-like protein
MWRRKFNEAKLLFTPISLKLANRNRTSRRKIYHGCASWPLLSFCFIFLVTGCRDTETADALPSPVTPKDALSTFQLVPGFKIDLVASEPLIADPVAMEIDENGNLYVVENHGYPLDKTKSSKIKLLRDTDGDGQMDKSTVFADTLLMPTGVMRWKKGIMVTDAPHVYYMEDSNDDDKADVIEIMLTGFALSNPQHNLNTPIYGLDNWIYLAHERTVGTEVFKDEFGDEGKEIYFPSRLDAVRLPVNADGRNVRLRPETFELEVLASSTQYGHSFDTWGNHLLVNNSNHVMHSVIASEYLNRNPKLVVSTSTAYLADHGNAAEVFPITKTPDRQLLTDVGVMTSACSITAYTGGAFPAEYNNTSFVAEPVSNIIHVDKLNPKGSTFTASRVQDEKEFLASTDMWFRPVNMYIGPDGALYVVDYYREIIEHPEWLSDEVINSGRLYKGHDMGRIYRISYTGSDAADWTNKLTLGESSDETLVEKLAEPNSWWRRNAQRMLLDRKHKAIVPLLIEMTGNSTSTPGRLHALWTLEGLNELHPEQIETALRDPEPGIRVNAIKLAERHLKDTPGLAESLLKLRDDEDAKVRFQLLCTLGFVNTPEAAEVRNKILFQDVEDEFVQIAALSVPTNTLNNLLTTAFSRYPNAPRAYASLVRNISAMEAGTDNSKSFLELLKRATAAVPPERLSWQVPVLNGLAQGIQRRRSPLSSAEQKILLQTFFEHPIDAIKQSALEILQIKKPSEGVDLNEAIERARRMAGNRAAPENDQARAVHFLALRNPVVDAPLLTSLLQESQSVPVRLATLKALNAIPDETVSHVVLQQWENFAPALQDAALNTFMTNETRVRILLDAIEAGKIPQAAIGWQRSIRLMTQQDIALRNRARALLATDRERKKVIEDYQPSLQLKGDLAKGKIVHEKNCAICHQVKGESGIPFGPDLGTIQSWPASGILENILDPNQSISHGFDLWNITLTNGDSFQGVITEETASAITIRNANGQVNTVAREEMSSQRALNMSAMPVGLEKTINHQDMADLLAFLRPQK